jgi:hypothetical protein
VRTRFERPPEEPATLTSVRNGIERLCRDIGSLKGEVNQLSNLIARFKKGRDLKPFIYVPPVEFVPGHSDSTKEPRSRIQDALFDLGSADSIEALSAITKAISKDLDGALRDIRSTRLDVKSITDDPDYAKEFRDWKADQEDR